LYKKYRWTVGKGNGLGNQIAGDVWVTAYLALASFSGGNLQKALLEAVGKKPKKEVTRKILAVRSGSPTPCAWGGCHRKRWSAN
jgi:hypothetical protein